MNHLFSALSQVITSRRTVKPQAMNARPIDNDLIKQVLILADFAPTHGLTEPWRFVVFDFEKRLDFCRQHAELYRMNTSEEKFEQAKYEKLLHMGDLASHIVIAIMKRGSLEKIPVWEEEAATAVAIQNVLLGATALGIASYWGSGGMARKKEMKHWLGLEEEDAVIGILYFGYAEKTPKFQRNIPFSEKLNWR
jgi:nitroreductase